MDETDWQEYRDGGNPTAETQHSVPGHPAIRAEIMAEVQQALQGKTFTSEEAFQAYVGAIIDRHNRQPQDDFTGLSPEQMQRLLNRPLASPELVTFPSQLEHPPSAPILTLFTVLVEAIGEEGLKATAAGNLPQRVVYSAAAALLGTGGYAHPAMLDHVHRESDLWDLHLVRLVAQRKGLIRKLHGRYLLTKKYRTLTQVDGLRSIYPLLLATWAEEFNWALDALHPIPLIQLSWAFSLYLLHRFGDEWRPMTFYEDAFLRAFPVLLDLVPSLTYLSSEQVIRHCYSFRCLRHFAGFLGLVEIHRESENLLDQGFQLRRTSLFSDAVRFHI